jgi:membrane protease YdiL (CAAX protease family)
MSFAIANSILLLIFFFFVNVAFCSSFFKNSAVLCACFILAVVLLRFWNIVHVALYFCLFSLLSVLLGYYHVFFIAPFPLFFPLLVSTLIVLPFAKTRDTLSWWKIGHLDRSTWILTIITGFVAVGALIIWAVWSDNLGLGVKSVQSMSTVPLWLLAGLGVPLFAMANAFAEEVLCRGIVQEAAMRTLRHPALMLAAQSSIFAALHFKTGFPNGVVGYGMVFVYGIMLGILRLRSKGLLAPWLAHVISDLTIGYVLLYFGYNK